MAPWQAASGHLARVLAYRLRGLRAAGVSFWEDLQAWTQAQYDALMLANAKRKRKWTAEDINKLLRDRISKRLKAKKGRAIGAEFLRTASRNVPHITSCISSGGLYHVLNFAYGSIFLPDPAPEGTTQQYSFVTPLEDRIWTRSELGSSASFDNHYITTGDPLIWRYPKSLVAKKVGLYSGEMKRVVQLLAGQNAEIPYEYGWPTTHGIYINSTGTGTRYWVIEVASTGIQAWPLGITAPTCSSGLPHVPGYLPVPVTDLSSITGKITLASESTMADAYEGGPLSMFFGWAFSGSGHECQNVVLKPGFGPTDEHYKSFRYKTTIAADGNGDPVSASLSEEQSGWAFTPHFNKHIRTPEMTSSGPSCPRFPFWTINPSTWPVAEDVSFPVNVYYIGEQEKVFTYTTRYPTTETVEATPVSELYDPMDCSSLLLTADAFGVDYNSGERIDIQGAIIEGPTGANTNLDNTLSVYDHTESRFDLSSSFGGIRDESGGRIFGSAHQLEKTTTYFPGGSSAYSFSLMFPLFEREGYLFQQAYSEETSGDTILLASKTLVGGTSEHQATGWGLQNWTYRNSEFFCVQYPSYTKYLGPCTEIDPSPPTAISEYVPFSGTANGTTLPIVGSATTTCCTDDNAKFVVYPQISTLTAEIICNAETIIAEQATTTTTSFVGQVSANGLSRAFSLPYDPVIFEGGIYDEVYLWMGAWADAFTATGWVSGTARCEIFGTGEKVFLGQANGHYPMISGFTASQHSGWFGVPFPEYTTPST